MLTETFGFSYYFRHNRQIIISSKKLWIFFNKTYLNLSSANRTSTHRPLFRDFGYSKKLSWNIFSVVNAHGTSSEIINFESNLAWLFFLWNCWILTTGLPDFVSFFEKRIKYYVAVNNLQCYYRTGPNKIYVIRWYYYSILLEKKKKLNSRETCEHGCDGKPIVSVVRARYNLDDSENI